jgi:hypothetical protein
VFNGSAAPHAVAMWQRLEISAITYTKALAFEKAIPRPLSGITVQQERETQKHSGTLRFAIYRATVCMQIDDARSPGLSAPRLKVIRRPKPNSDSWPSSNLTAGRSGRATSGAPLNRDVRQHEPAHGHCRLPVEALCADSARRLASQSSVEYAVIGLIVLTIFVGWLVLAAFLVRAIARLTPAPVLVGIAIFPATVMLPFVDELVGRWQFSRLCNAEAKVYVAPNAYEVFAARRDVDRMTGRGGLVIPVTEQAFSYVDARTGATFYSVKAFHTPGGFVMRAGLNMGGSTSCWPSRWSSAENGLNIDEKLAERYELHLAGCPKPIKAKLPKQLRRAPTGEATSNKTACRYTGDVPNSYECLFEDWAPDVALPRVEIKAWGTSAPGTMKFGPINANTREDIDVSLGVDKSTARDDRLIASIRRFEPSAPRDDQGLREKYEKFFRDPSTVLRAVPSIGASRGHIEGGRSYFAQGCFVSVVFFVPYPSEQPITVLNGLMRETTVE